MTVPPKTVYVSDVPIGQALTWDEVHALLREGNLVSRETWRGGGSHRVLSRRHHSAPRAGTRPVWY